VTKRTEWVLENDYQTKSNQIIFTHNI